MTCGRTGCRVCTGGGGVASVGGGVGGWGGGPCDYVMCSAEADRRPCEVPVCAFEAEQSDSVGRPEVSSDPASCQ